VPTFVDCSGAILPESSVPNSCDIGEEGGKTAYGGVAGIEWIGAFECDCCDINLGG